jgi:O-antigen/teichoic acid export membrane protein
MAVACAVASLLWIATKEQAFSVARHRIASDWFHNWSFARWALAGYLTSGISVHVMPWIVLYFHGKGPTGLLAAAWSLGGMANLFVNGIDSFLAPKAARAFIDGGTCELRRVLRWANTLFLVTVGLMLLVFLAAQNEIVAVTYGEQYSAIIPIVAMFIMSVLIRSLGMVAGNGLWALERPRANFVANVWAVIVAVGSALVLVPGLNLVGAALATLAGAVVGTALRGVFLRRSLNVAFAKEQS